MDNAIANAIAALEHVQSNTRSVLFKSLASAERRDICQEALTTALTALRAQAEAEKPVHVVEQPESNNGLKVKYNVTKTKDGTPVYDCFVLRPDKDPAAVEALRAYAQATPNRALAADIQAWVGPPQPLTLEQLRERDGQPVWISGINRWGIVSLRKLNGKEHEGEYRFTIGFCYGWEWLEDALGSTRHAYDRPPEAPHA